MLKQSWRHLRKTLEAKYLLLEQETSIHLAIFYYGDQGLTLKHAHM